MFCNPLIRSRTFSKPVCLDCDLHKCFSTFTPRPSDKVGRLQGDGVEYFPSSTSKAGGGRSLGIFLPKVI